MQRIVEEEWLDRAECSPQQIEAALASVNHVNRRFGGVALHARLLRRALARAARGRRPPSILEVGSGQAEVLREALIALEASAEVTLLDQHARHLPDPSSWQPPLPAPRLCQADALALPQDDQSVDIVSTCLFLHHLEPPQITRFLAEAIRVARVAVLINDLERNWIHYALARWHGRFDPSAISVHDGPISVRRAYTRYELARMLDHTGLCFELERAFPFRLGAVLWLA